MYVLQELNGEFCVLYENELVYKSTSKKQSESWMKQRQAKEEKCTDSMIELIQDGFFF